MKFGETVEVEYEGLSHDKEFKCPNCNQRIPIYVNVEVTQGGVRYVGSSGFNKPNFSASLSTKIRTFRIKEHICEVKERTD